MLQFGLRGSETLCDTGGQRRVINSSLLRFESCAEVIFAEFVGL